MTDTPAITVPTADIDRINKAVLAFHKAEDVHSAEAIRAMIVDAVKLATVVQPVRAAFWTKEIATNAKAKAPSAARMADLMGATFRGTKADMDLALSIPCGTEADPYDPTKAPSESAVNKLLVSYRARCTSPKNDDGETKAPTVPTWQGFRSFLAQSAAYRRAQGSGKFDPKTGMLTDGAKKVRDDATTASDQNAATVIASPFHETETAAHVNDPVEAYASVLCIRHDADASAAKLAAGMTEAQLKLAQKRYRDLLTAAKVNATAAALVTV